MNDSIVSHRAPEPVGPYPHARRVGDLLFLSGVARACADRRKSPA
jgi:2-aminomuconate deaminase